MKLYVISADTYDDSYGSQISIFGVYDKDHVDIALKGLQEKYDYYFEVNEVNLNECKDIYLGSYFE